MTYFNYKYCNSKRGADFTLVFYKTGVEVSAYQLGCNALDLSVDAQLGI